MARYRSIQTSFWQDKAAKKSKMNVCDNDTSQNEAAYKVVAVASVLNNG